ncbi:hypothetical protein RJ639_036560, partial [Escallonia herrerae]
MNIVKGVADLIRRTSSGQSGDSGSGAQQERFSAPTPRIRFSEVGDEAILNTLLDKFNNAREKAERKRLFHIFLKEFLTIYKNWKPVDLHQPPDTALSVNTSGTQPTTEQLGPLMSLTIKSEGLPVLDVLTIITRSMHNCRVFGYYGGIQKLTALMKAAVVQLKTLISTLSTDESLSSSAEETSRNLQKILVNVVSIIWNFVDSQSNVYKEAQLNSKSLEFSTPRGGATSIEPSSGMKASLSERGLRWHQTAIVSVMEAGGLNWLVELLRVMRRLNMKEQWTDISLQHLTLRTLLSALADNPRGQNHFRSIGGLEVLLDGLGVPSSSAVKSNNFSCADKN